MKKIIKELRRRNVFKATIAYLVVAWLLLQVASVILPIVEAPEWILKAFVFVLAVGLPIWVVISWIYDFTPQGIEKTPAVTEDQIVTQITDNRLNMFILVGLIIVAIILALNISVFSSKANNTIAILPFENMVSDEGNEWLSKGVTSDIRSYLSKIELPEPKFKKLNTKRFCALIWMYKKKIIPKYIWKKVLEEHENTRQSH